MSERREIRLFPLLRRHVVGVMRTYLAFQFFEISHLMQPFSVSILTPCEHEGNSVPSGSFIVIDQEGSLYASIISRPCTNSQNNFGPSSECP